ncbi:MAG: RNA polymerase sigma factor, partial [Planctomycetota bacterium]
MPAGVDLEDLLQEVAMRFVGQLHTLQDPGALRPWLRAVAMNVARSAIRTAVRRAHRGVGRGPGDKVAAAMLPLVLDDVPDPRQEQARRNQQARDRADHVLALIQRLQPDYREPLLLRCVRGLTQRQVAEALDLPVTTVETRLARARRMLRRELAENPPDE